MVHVPQRRNRRGINKKEGLASSSLALLWDFQITDDVVCQAVQLCDVGASHLPSLGLSSVISKTPNLQGFHELSVG